MRQGKNIESIIIPRTVTQPTTTKIERRGGRRSYQLGRPRSGQRTITIQIKQDILDRLQPGAAAKIRELVETTFKS